MDEDMPRTIGVMLATHRRPDGLLRCLAGLAAQTRLPDDVIVVMRATDTATRGALASVAGGPLPIRVAEVAQPGLIAARNAGVAVCRTDVLAMTDDDAVPHPDWLERILAHFQRDPRLGGLGGRDRCYDDGRFDDTQAAPVGKLQWFGRTIGNHHRGFGPPRQVDILKGANMSYRATVFVTTRFDTALRGAGAQPNEDMRFSLQVGQAGWRLLYDPQVMVDHYTATRDEPRLYGGVMEVSNAAAFRELAYNEVAAIWDIMPLWRRVVFALWSVLVGTRVSPGLAQALRFTPRLGRLSWRRFALNMQGKLAAIRALGWRPAGAVTPADVSRANPAARPSGLPSAARDR